MWMMFALIASLAAAYFAALNQIYKLPGWQLMFWRGLIPVVVLSPCVFVLPAPHSPLFYLFVCVNAIIVRYSDTRILDACARFGAALPLRISPIVPVCIFFIWLAIDPSYAAILWHNKLRFMGICAALILCAMGLITMLNCATTRAALGFYLLPLVGGIAVDVFNKLAMGQAGAVNGPVYYILVHSAIVFINILPQFWREQRGKEALDMRATWLPGLMLSGVMIFLMFSKNMAMSMTPNPAYVSAIIYSSSIWISLWNHIYNHKDTGDVRAGLFFVLGAVLLLFLA